MSLIALVFIIPLSIFSFIIRFKIESALYRHIGSSLFNINPHSAEQVAYVPEKPKPPKTLEEHYSHVRKFRVGQFRAGIERKLNTRGTGDVSLAELAVLTFFYTRIPDSSELNFSIDLPLSKSKNALSANSPEEFVSYIDWNIPDHELAERFGHKDFILTLNRLFSNVSPCEIRCDGTRFIICTKRPIKRVEQLLEFRKYTPEIFRMFAQVAQLRLNSWRHSANNHDWWSSEEQEEN